MYEYTLLNWLFFTMPLRNLKKPLPLFFSDSLVRVEWWSDDMVSIKKTSLLSVVFGDVIMQMDIPSVFDTANSWILITYSRITKECPFVCDGRFSLFFLPNVYGTTDSLF